MTTDDTNSMPVSRLRRRFLALVSCTLVAPLLEACQAPAEVLPPTPAPPATSVPAPTQAVAAPTPGPPAATLGPPQPIPTALPVRASPTVIPPEIIVGVAYPLTGPLAAFGAQARAAVELAQDIVNNPAQVNVLLAREQGLTRLGGARVRAVTVDHRGDPAFAASEAERLLVQDKAVALFGMLQEPVTASASRVAERIGVPLMAPEWSMSAVRRERARWLIRPSPDIGQSARASFQMINELETQRGIHTRTIGLLYDDTLQGQASAKAAREQAEQAGYSVGLDIQFRSRASSLSAEIGQLKEAAPDIWIVSAHQPDAVQIVRQSREQDCSPKLVVGLGLGHSAPEFVDEIGKEAEGYLAPVSFHPDLAMRRPAVRIVSGLFRERTGEDLTELTARVVAAFLILCNAIDRALSTRPDRIRQALIGTIVPGDLVPMPWKGVRFNAATGQNDLATPVLVQLQGSAYHTVWPSELAARPIHYPIPPWSQRP